MPIPDHLQLARVPRPPLQRRKVKRFVPRNPRHTNVEIHARDLDHAANEALDALRSRQASNLDFDPKLMLKFELNRRIADDEWRPAGLTLLDSSDTQAAVVFAARNDLDRFKRRLAEYSEGPRLRQRTGESSEEETAARYEAFFDAIDGFRPLQAPDRITGRLMRLLEAEPSVIREFDVELWFHSDAGVREDWLAELRDRVSTLGGDLVDEYIGERAAVVLARVRGDRAVAHGLAELDQVSQIDSLPTPALEPDALMSLQESERLPEEIPSPPDDAPVVGMIDTGVRAGHPLLEPAIVDTVALDPSFGGQDEDAHGHGTAVAGRILFGDVLNAVSTNNVAAPFWLASVRVLDEFGRPPTNTNWVASIAEAVRYLAEELDCRIINMSFGDADSPYTGGKSTPLAAELDTLARQYQLLIIISAGNIAPAMLIPAAEVLTDWPRYLIDAGHQILDPAQASLALTVGAYAGNDGLSTPAAGTSLGRAPVATSPGPAPYTRHGPGVRQAIKPEVSAEGGNWVFDRGTGALVKDPAVEVVSTSARYPAELFATAVGTSFAAPEIAHMAGRLQAKYPAFSANTLRALIAQSAVCADSLSAHFEIFDRPEVELHNLCGYGVPDLARAATSSEQRVVLYSEDAVRPDAFHIYRIPMTDTFTTVSGPRSITVALACDPPVRHRRFDYLAYQMDFLLVRGLGLGDLFEMAAAGIAEPGAGRLGTYEVPLRPTRTTRSRGTLQVGRFRSTQRLRSHFHDDWYLVVRSINKWMPPDADPQRYSVAVALEVERGEDLYAELEAQVRIDLEVRLSATVGV